jgi:radical SAM enzyme (TIGR01210 family)
VSASDTDRRIRSLRPPKRLVDPYAAFGAVVEDERRPDGNVERAMTVFLSGAECPFTCAFCDLWQYTIDGPTPPAALSTQLERVLQEHARQDEVLPTNATARASAFPDRIKLYNASNWFDKRAVPLADLPRIVELTAPFKAITVESHASTIGAATHAFARQIDGRLEVAMGLETIEPVAAAQLNKRLDLATFDRAAQFLAEHGIDLRVFVLLGVPGIPVRDSVDWTVRSVEYAVARGASVVSIVPVRGGNGELERLAAAGQFTPPTLGALESALDRSLQFTSAVVTADLWDVERLVACAACHGHRVARLQRMNITGIAVPAIVCASCAA